MAIGRPDKAWVYEKDVCFYYDYQASIIYEYVLKLFDKIIRFCIFVKPDYL